MESVLGGSPGTERSWVVAIPTYDRPGLIQKATLAYLDRSGVPAEQVTIFVAPEQRPLYDGLPRRWQDRLVLSELGLANSRRWAEWNYYPAGTRVVWLNDDVFGLYQKYDTRLAEVPLAQVADEGWELCGRAGARLWGVYAVHNAFYMKNRVKTDLCHIVGCAYGVRTRREPALYPEFGDAKEDYERCLRFWDRDAVSVRMDYYCVKTIYYNSPVICANAADVERNVRALESRWPQRVRRNLRRKSPFPEILIRLPGRRPVPGN